MGTVFRPAHDDDAVALRDLERAAGLAALAHVFPPERHPFPDDGVLDRWRTMLADPTVAVVVAEGRAPRAPVAVAAYDADTLRHLAVHPDHWGGGLGTRAVAVACADMARGGAERAWLWCLEANTRARRLYAHLGWAETGETRQAEWPPYPTELRYTRNLG